MDSDIGCRRIVVALDGSEAAEGALPVAMALARHVGVPVHLVRVADGAELLDSLQPLTPDAFSRELAVLEGMVAEYLERVRGRLGAGDLAVTSELRTGNAARQLLGVAGCGDLIVMTRCGRGGGPAMGTVAERVVAQARTAVFLVPATVAGPVPGRIMSPPIKSAG